MATIKADVNIGVVSGRKTIDVVIDYGQGITHNEYGALVAFLMNDMAKHSGRGYEATIERLTRDAMDWGLKGIAVKENPDE